MTDKTNEKGKVTATSLEAYQCPQCASYYDNEEDAQGCCSIDCVDAWRCSECDEIYEEESEAEECCEEEKK
jgi:hypothetical protein